MKTRHYISLLLGILLGISHLYAQNSNRLYIPDLTALPGSTASIPIYVENTTEIVAVQFILQVPEGSSLKTGTAALTNRSADHTVTMRPTASREYTCVIYSPTNSPLKGRTGKLMTVDMQVGGNYAESSTHAFTLKDVVLSLRDGSNVLSAVDAGTLTISKCPDLSVKNVNAGKTTCAPDETLGIGWQVENIGDVETGDGWSEQISLVQTDGTSVLIGTTHYDETLSPSGSVSRQATVTLPQFLGLDGNAKVQVQVIPLANTGESEGARGNNIATTATALSISKQLTLTLPTSSIEENYAQPIRCTLARSGNRTQEQTFALSATADSRLTIPQEVTIPAGQSAASFYIQIKDNTTLDNSGLITVTASGNGYKAVNGQITIEDNEYPDLTLTASKSQVTEGETFQLTVTTSRVSATPIEVMLTSENIKRFLFPSKVTIPAGETTAQVTVEAVDDELPSLDLTNAFTASASGYNKGDVLVILKDNDLPVLELMLTPSTVSEGAGVVAVAGMLKRTTNTNSKITVKLSDDANGGLYFGNRTIELAKGVEEVHFNFGPVDNAIVDGDRNYTITAAVWLSSCSCGASGESAGYVTAQLQVLDNDGAALNLTSSLSTVKEGGKTMLTISRNTTDNSEPLTVTLQSDYDNNLTYNHTVIIPAGQTSTTVEVTSNGNDVQGDSHTVVFTAQAEGYATGTCYLMVTDQTLPDACVTDLTISQPEIVFSENFQVSITVTNLGFATLPSQTPINLYLEENKTLFGRMFTQAVLLPGETTSVIKTFQNPTLVGKYKMYAIVNESYEYSELQYSNNISSYVEINFLPQFKAAIKSDKACYQPNEPVMFVGKAEGTCVVNTEVEVYIINNGLRQVLTATTNELGEFQLIWHPYEKQKGHFIIGACVPGEGNVEEQYSFDILGITTQYAYSTVELNKGETYSDSIVVTNPCSIPLNNVKVVPQKTYSDVVYTSQPVATIGAYETAVLRYSIQGDIATEGDDWLQMPLMISSEEVCESPYQLYYYVHTPKGRLQSNVANINTTMLKGKSRDYPIVIKNTGKGNTGRVMVDTGGVSWLSCANQSELTSLDYGDSITIVLRFTPSDDIQLNNTLQGWLAINCESGEGCVIGLSVEPVSNEMGLLTVDACDEYTYYTKEAPHVQGAIVQVMHPIHHNVIATGTTNVDGRCSIELPEGNYYVEVKCEGHNMDAANIFINPDRETLLTSVLLLETVHINVRYEETEIEDMYNITTTMTYETNVPSPVVITSLPDSLPVATMRCGEAIIIDAIITNKGLVSAQNVHIEYPEISGLKFEILENKRFDLLPQQSVLVPIVATRTCNNPGGGGSGGGSGGSSGGGSTYSDTGSGDLPCFIPIYTYHSVPCDKYKEQCSCVFIGLKPCASSSFSAQAGQISESSQTPTNKPHSSSSSDGKDTRIRSGNIPIVIPPDCDNSRNNPYPYLAQFIECITKGLYGAAYAGMGIAFCAEDFIQCVKGKNSGASCMKSAIGCIPLSKKAGTVRKLGSPFTSYFGCEEFLNQFKNSYNNGGTKNLKVGLIAANYRMPKYIYESIVRMIYVGEAIHGEYKYIQEVFGNDNFFESEIFQAYNMFDAISFFEVGKIVNLSDVEAYKPENISDEEFAVFIERINNTIRIKNGEIISSDNYIHEEKVNAALNQISTAKEFAMNQGFSSVDEMMNITISNLIGKYSEFSRNVCATVSLKIDQKLTMTRKAIRGIVTIENSHEQVPMTDIKMNFILKNKNDSIATSREFLIKVDSLYNLKGKYDLNSGWTLDSNETGTASILFIPTKYAAPTEPEDWDFSGTLSYIDPLTGLEVTRVFSPVTLTVKPSPDLNLTYFMQRDVYGDDPLTEEVEPMEPAEFSLLINNIGYGEASNVRMVTNQPKIIENEKGLFINFEILSSQLNGGEKTLALGGSVGTDFGNIPAHSQAYAQWWLQSSLLGHFTDYDVKATHVTSYGNPDLSLLNEVSIHELIRSIKVDNGSVTGFVANDLVDAEDTPDVVYFTDGTTADVAVAANAIWQEQSNTEYLLTITPSQPGWNYGHITDPTFGRATLIGIRRQSDGKEINPRNFWQTDRTLRDGKDWLYENNLHFVDQMTNSAETYILTFEPRPDMELQIASFEGAPEEGVVLREPLQKVIVTFNKAIDASTFTNEDITLHCQGTRIDIPISITPLSDTKFMLDLSQLTAGNGYYVLTVQTAGITDFEGFAGSVGKTATWIQFTEATTLALSFYEKELIYGDSFTEPRVITNSLATPTFTSTNPLVASVDAESGKVSINAVGTTQVNVSIEETPMSDAASTAYRLTVLQPEGKSDAPAGLETVNITIPDGETMVTYCSPWPIDFSDATDKCRAYVALTYHDDIVVCKEVAEAKGGVGLLIVGKPGTYTFPVRTSFNDPMENLFVGTLAPTYIEEMTGNKTNLGLKVNKFLPLDAGVVKANKAYLPIEMENGVDAMNIVLQALTGLHIVTEQGDSDVWYHVSGMKVNRPSSKGIYIQDGRKVILK